MGRRKETVRAAVLQKSGRPCGSGDRAAKQRDAVRLARNGEGLAGCAAAREERTQEARVTLRFRPEQLAGAGYHLLRRETLRDKQALRAAWEIEFLA